MCVTLGAIMVAIIVFLLAISVLVFVHELGHFLAARLFGVGVRSFAIGFQPTLWSRKVGQTTYKINAVPMGGYVALVGEGGEEQDENDNEFSPDQYMNSKPWWQKIVILSAGVVMNFIFAAVILVVLSLVTHGLSGFVSGLQLYLHICGEVFWGMWQFFAGLFSGAGLGDVAGPVGIANILGQAASVGFAQVCFLTALLSINLGIMNLIPFPALDGGQIAVVLVEKITNRPLSMRAQGVINMVGFAALLLLMVIVSVQDVVKLF